MKKSILNSSAVVLLTFGAVVLSSSTGVTATGKQGKNRRATQKQEKVVTTVQPVNESGNTSAAAPATDLLSASEKSLNNPASSSTTATNAKADSKKSENKAVPSGPSRAFVATAYSLRGRMANGAGVHKGAIAADPRVLPIGTRVYLNAGNMSGEYVVGDTGGSIKGRRIDIWVPSRGNAMSFGRRGIQLTVLSGKRAVPADNAQSEAKPKAKAKAKQ